MGRNVLLFCMNDYIPNVEFPMEYPDIRSGKIGII